MRLYIMAVVPIFVIGLVAFFLRKKSPTNVIYMDDWVRSVRKRKPGYPEGWVEEPKGPRPKTNPPPPRRP